MNHHIRNHVLSLASVLALAGAGGNALAQQPAPPGGAGPHVVKLTNSGKTTITAVYVSAAGSPDVSDDLLGKQTAGAGRTVTLKVQDPKAACTFDLQFLMNNGDTVTKKAVNLCQTADYTFTP